MPKISVVIPFYNDSDSIRSTLDSFKNQTYKDFEVLICDDDSIPEEIDALKTLMTEYQDLMSWKLIRTNKNTGPGMARKRGIEASNSDHITFCDADDLFLPEKLELSIMELERGIDFTWGDAILRKGNTESLKDRSRIASSPSLVQGQLIMGRLNKFTSGISATKKALEKLDFEPELRFCEDWYLLFQAYQFLKVGYINQPLSVKVDRDESYSAKANKKWQNEKRKSRMLYFKLLQTRLNVSIFRLIHWNLVKISTAVLGRLGIGKNTI